jgi:hypothetical protein
VPRCRICRDPLLAEIEAALAGGTRFPEITARFGVPERTVRYHRARHMPTAGVEGAGGSTADTDEGQR